LAAHLGPLSSFYDRYMGRQDASESQSAGVAGAPPEAPHMQRRFHLYGYQYIGLPLLLLIPLLALFGVFGPTMATVEARSDGTVLSVMYPERAHYQAYTRLRVVVRNTGGDVQNAAAVEFERELLDRFSQIVFNPSLSEITDSVYRVDIGQLPSGAERAVTVDLRPEANGPNRGVVTVSAEGRQDVQAEIVIFVLP
jgi:hypothetical protein